MCSSLVLKGLLLLGFGSNLVFGLLLEIDIVTAINCAINNLESYNLHDSLMEVYLSPLLVFQVVIEFW